MFRIKLFFIIILIAISTFLILNYIKFDLKTDEMDYKNEILKITGISPEAYLYRDRDMKTLLTLEDLDFKRDQAIMTPQLVAIELLYKDLFLELHPLTYVEFSHTGGKLVIITGELYWNRAVSGKTKIFLGKEGRNLDVSGKGRLKLTESGELKIWNFKGSSVMGMNSGRTELKSGMFYLINESGKINSEKILSSPGSISPKNGNIFLTSSKDSIIKFECVAVANASGYIFRLYSSRLRENVLTEKKSVANRTNFNLAGFEGRREFYWDVTPLNMTNSEGEPSMTGKILLHGSTYGESMDIQPPELTIISLTVNGNIVLIKGKTEPGATLFIDDVPVPLEQDGSFIYTRGYKSMGLKTIKFRIVSAAEIENVITRQVSIFEE